MFARYVARGSPMLGPPVDAAAAAAAYSSGGHVVSCFYSYIIFCPEGISIAQTLASRRSLCVCVYGQLQEARVATAYIATSSFVSFLCRMQVWSYLFGRVYLEGLGAEDSCVRSSFSKRLRWRASGRMAIPQGSMEF